MQASAQFFTLTEADIRAFLQEAPRSGLIRRWQQAFLALVFVIVLPFLGFFALNYAAYQQLDAVAAPSVTAAATPTAKIALSVPAPTLLIPATATPLPAAAFAAPTLPTNTVGYSDLSLSVPVNWNTAFNEDTIQQKLQNGVVHIAGTALPGQHGFSVIFGHSSNYPWAKGSYNSVFAVLHKAAVGQSVVVNYNDKEYSYKVTKIYIVQPDDLSVLEDGNGDGLRLITCTPIGTSQRRLVVEATQIKPDPSANAPFTHSRFSGSVPSGR